MQPNTMSDVAAQFVRDMLLHHDTYGYLPIWDLWGQENYCMIGNHAIPVISDAIFAEIPGIDVEKAYKAMVESSTRSHRNSPFEVWEEYGYMPQNLQKMSVSITLEQAFDDWCVAAVAKKLGKTEDYERFHKRSESYRNLLCESLIFMKESLHAHRNLWIRYAEASITPLHADMQVTMTVDRCLHGIFSQPSASR